MKPWQWASAGLAAIALSGCSSLVAPPYSTDYAALDRLRKMPLQKVAVDPVQPTDPAAPVNSITLRAAKLVGPKGTFAKYLEDALIQDLQEIAVYDQGADLRLEATILKNEIDINGFSTGTGQLDVDMTVKRASSVVLRRSYTATIQFESSFAGAVAIPRGQLEYSRLVKTLLGKVYADPDFIAALTK